MISHNIATLEDKNGRNNIEVEVNKKEEFQDDVEFKVKDNMGEWIKSRISIKDLYGLIFVLVGHEEQQEMMPVRRTEVRYYERQHRIKCKRDMKKGEEIIANCKISVPLVVEEGLRGLLKKRQTKSGILVPKKGSIF